MDLNLSIGCSSYGEKESDTNELDKGFSYNENKRSFSKSEDENSGLPMKLMKLSSCLDNSAFSNLFQSGSSGSPPLNESVKQRLRRFLSDPIHWGNLRKQSRLYYQFSEALRSMREKNPSEILDLRWSLRNNEKITATVIRTQSRPVLQVLAYILSDETSITASRVNRLVEICLQSGHWQDAPVSNDAMNQFKISMDSRDNDTFENCNVCSIGRSDKEEMNAKKCDSNTTAYSKCLREGSKFTPSLKDDDTSKLYSSLENFQARLESYCNFLIKENLGEKEKDMENAENESKSEANEVLNSNKAEELKNVELKIKKLKLLTMSSRNYAMFILDLHKKLTNRVSNLNSIAQSLEFTLKGSEEIEAGSCSVSSEANEGNPWTKPNQISLNLNLEHDDPEISQTSSVKYDDTLTKNKKNVNSKYFPCDGLEIQVKEFADRENFINEVNTKSAIFQISETMDYLEEAMESARTKMTSVEAELHAAEQEYLSLMKHSDY